MHQTGVDGLLDPGSVRRQSYRTESVCSDLVHGSSYIWSAVTFRFAITPTLERLGSSLLPLWLRDSAWVDRPKKDMVKVVEYSKLSAKKGFIQARHNLGGFEKELVTFVWRLGNGWSRPLLDIPILWRRLHNATNLNLLPNKNILLLFHHTDTCKRISGAVRGRQLQGETQDVHELYPHHTCLEYCFFI